MLRQAAMWMSSQQPANALNSPMTLFPYLPKRDSLLYVAQPLAVTLTCDAPSRALCPGISVSSGEPSGVFVSWYCLSSSRSLGHSLKRRTFRSFCLLVLLVVESFPGTQSPLGSKEPIEPFVGPHKVVASSTLPMPGR